MNQTTNFKISYVRPVDEDGDVIPEIEIDGEKIRTPTWEVYKLAVRGIFSNQASVVFNDAAKSAKVTCMYLISDDRRDEKFGKLVHFTRFTRMLSNFTEEENDSYGDLKDEYGLNPKRKEPATGKRQRNRDDSGSESEIETGKDPGLHKSRGRGAPIKKTKSK